MTEMLSVARELPFYYDVGHFVVWRLMPKPRSLKQLSSMPEQWQLTLDVIKSKAQTLMVENNGLQVEYRQLIRQVQKLQRSIDDQQNKNDQMERFLNERHGQTDQQVRIEELTQVLKQKGSRPGMMNSSWKV